MDILIMVGGMVSLDGLRPDRAATYWHAVRETPIASGVAALYAYERQVPAVAQAKIDGLRAHHGIADGPGLGLTWGRA